MEENRKKYVDPDPFVLADLCLVGASVIIQLVQIYISRKDTIDNNVEVNGIRRSQLQHIEKALEEYDRSIFEAERAVRRGSSSPTREFYGAQFRIAQTDMNIDQEYFDDYASSISYTMNKLGNLTLWIHTLIKNDPSFAAIIGREVDQITSGASDRMNLLIDKRGPNEAIILEAKLVRDALRDVLFKHLDRTENS